MAVEIEPMDELALWNRPAAGQVAPWVRWSIAAACAITVAVVFASTHAVWMLYEPFPGHEDLFMWGPPLVVSLAIAIAFAPRATTSRWLRMALLLPVIHVVVMIVTWRLATVFHLFDVGDIPSLACEQPVLPFAIAMLGLTIGAGSSIGRRRRREGRHAAVTIALANLLLLGLWLPVASRLLAGTGQSLDRAVVALHDPVTLVAVVFAPPFAIACAYAAALVYVPRHVSRLRSAIVLALLTLFSVAVELGAGADPGKHLLYEELVNEVLAVAFVAVALVALLGTSTWIDSRRIARRLRRGVRRCGTIEPRADDVVACLHVTSWLCGPRLVSQPFVVTTDRGDLLVPGGIEVAAGLPLVSSVLRIGEAVALLRGGDRVALAGFIEATPGDHPFRSAGVLVPEPAGVVVDLVDAPTTTALQAVQLAIWRPAIAYLAIVAVVALPGLLGLVGRRWW